VFLKDGSSRINSVMNSITYMSEPTVIHIYCNPFNGNFVRMVSFHLDFHVEDYTTFGCDKLIAVSRSGWLGVYYENLNMEVVHSNSF
jgi:hypothetical protein